MTDAEKYLKEAGWGDTELFSDSGPFEKTEKVSIIMEKFAKKNRSECNHNNKILPFLKWGEWAEKQFRNGVEQKQCKNCGLWFFPEEM